MMENVTLRPGRVEDAPSFKRVFEMASEGLAPWVWTQRAGPGGDRDAVGLASMEKKIAGAAPGTCIVADCDGLPAGGIITYDIGGTPEEIEPDTPAAFVPLIELENLAPHTHYINALAVFPEFRGRGIGRRLLRAMSAHAGKNGMSLIAENGNTPALALYHSEGYAVHAERPVIEGDGWTCPGDRWMLMVRPPA